MTELEIEKNENRTLRNRIDELLVDLFLFKTLIAECPLGFNNDKLVLAKSTEEKDVVAWLRRLYAAAEEP